MRWCRSCILPDTRPNLTIGADGICNACRSHQSRREIDWAARARAFADVVARAKRQSAGYDCLIPVSGGKDSTWQVVTCLEAGLKPLAVTWRPPGRTAIGQANLDNLIKLGVDHIDYTIDPKVEARFMVKAFERFGSTAIPMHLALFNIPLTLAVRMRIPLIVWGENSAFEYGSADEAHTGFKLDRAWLETYGVTHGTTAADWIDATLTEKDLTAYFGPDPDSLEAEGVHAVFLGYYFPWDPETSFRVARVHGFRAAPEGARTGLYDYADIDDDFISLHHWMKWYKFGFTRLFDNLSLEIRNGRVTRDAAVAQVRARGDDTPTADIRKFCAFARLDEARFFTMAERFRNLEIWQRRGGTWTIPGFLIEDWDWKAAA
jgi:N-acetyl sugar amidotransferase